MTKTSYMLDNKLYIAHIVTDAAELEEALNLVAAGEARLVIGRKNPGNAYYQIGKIASANPARLAQLYEQFLSDTDGIIHAFYEDLAIRDELLASNETLANETQDQKLARLMGAHDYEWLPPIHITHAGAWEGNRCLLSDEEIHNGIYGFEYDSTSYRLILVIMP